MLNDYSHLTEADGCKISREQLQRMYTRYAFGAELAAGKDVLEVACGIGQGLGLLGAKARSVVAGDYTQRLVDVAKSHYGTRFDIRQFDAQAMPFESGSFDVILIYEAIYYLPDPKKFMQECKRILRPGGKVVICTANKDWSGFSKSPSSYEYFGAKEMEWFCKEMGFSLELFGDSPVSDGSVSGKLLSLVRTVFVRCHLMPKNIKAREKFKRLVFGRLIDMPKELDHGVVSYVQPTPIFIGAPNKDYKVLIAVASRL